MNAWALSRVEHLSPFEIVLAVAVGLFALWLILAIFGRKPRAAPVQSPPAPPRANASASDRLNHAIAVAELAIIKLAREKTPTAGAFHFGATEISPKHLAYWVTTATDAERDRLAADVEIMAGFRRALAEAGYPAELINDVAFEFESQETVNRVHGGNWWYAVK